MFLTIGPLPNLQVISIYAASVISTLIIARILRNSHCIKKYERTEIIVDEGQSISLII